MIETVLIVDTETQGLNSETDRVLEIGAVWWSVRHRCILATWSELCQAPTNPAEHINRIPTGALAHGLTFEQACDGLRSRATRADVLIAHRAEFDSAFLPNDLGKPWICSKFDIEWPLSKPGDSLAYVAIAHDVPIVSAHRALADCLLLARCFEVVGVASGVTALQIMLERAMRPRAKFAAVGVPYENRQLCKDAGFSWEGDTKRWTKRIALEDVALVPFKVERVSG